MNKVLIIIFTCLFFVSESQIKQDTSKKVNILPLPLIFRSPETLWALGMSGSVSFKTSFKNDSLTRTSNIQVLGLFTERKQNIQAVDATIYFPKEKYILYFQSSHTFFPDKYWGLGPDTKDNFENYRFEQFYLTAHFKKKVIKNTFVGVLYELQSLYNMRYKPNERFDTTITLGKNGSFVSGLGGSLGYDSRNSAFWPTKGIFVQTLITYFNTYFGSQFNDLKTIFDLRYYQKTFLNQVLAIQFYSYSNAGQAPIRELAMLGGSGNLRGFYQGRYRDNSMITGIAEYRIPIYWRLAACVFIGGGNVYNEIEDVGSVFKNVKYTYGGGLRIAVLKNEKLNLRLDYGYLNKFNKGFYFTIGECF